MAYRNNVDKNVLAENYVSYLNEFVLTQSNSFWLEEPLAQCSESFVKYILHQLAENDIDSGEVKNKKYKKITYTHFKCQFYEFQVWSAEMPASAKVDILVLTKN